MTVIEFDSLEKADAWHNPPEYPALRPIRQSPTRSRVMIDESVMPVAEWENAGIRFFGKRRWF